MSFKNGFRQVIKFPLTATTPIPLSGFLLSVKSALGNLYRLTVWAAHPVRPAQLPHHVVAPTIIYQGLDMDQPDCLRFSEIGLL